MKLGVRVVRTPHCFTGLLDILIRVGLPPAGLIGIPVAVTGTSEKPKIKFFSRKGQGILTAIYNSKIHKVVRDEQRDIKKPGREQRKERKAQVKQAKATEKKVDTVVKKISGKQ